LIGRTIGHNESVLTMTYSRYLLKIIVKVSVVLAVVLFIATPILSSLFEVSPATLPHLRRTLILFSAGLIVLNMNNLFFTGILRSGADNTFTLIVDTIAVWILGIPLIYMMGLRMHMSIEWVYGLILCIEIVKLVVAHKRFMNKKWIKLIE
jgi:Na+-driven multidrug efflux pump